MNLRFTAAAQRELNAALRRYLRDAGVDVAKRFDERVQKVLHLMCQMPEIGSPTPPELRIWPLRQFEYSLVYRAGPSEIVVIAVAHQRRAVGYWVGRR